MIGLNRPKKGKAAVIFPDFERKVNKRPDEPKFITGHVYDNQQIWQLRDLIEVEDVAQAPTNDESHEVIGIYLPDKGVQEIPNTASAEEAYDLDRYPLFLDNTHLVCTPHTSFENYDRDTYEVTIEYDDDCKTEFEARTAGKTVDEFEAEKGRISATVTGNNGNPLRGVDIEVCEKGEQTGGENEVNEQQGQTDKEGRATFYGLGPGIYEVTVEEGEFLTSHVRRPHETDEEITREELNVETVDLDRLFIRVESDGRTPLHVLNDKHVAIVGLGSGGGLIASYLAKSGVGEMTFIDDDLYETHNIVRHVCGEEALGREKVRAMEDYIEQRVPDVVINPVVEKFRLGEEDLENRFKQIFEDADMIISACAEADVNNQLDRFVHDNRIDAPVIYAGMFSNLKGGVMIRVDRNKNDPCYHCIYRRLESGGRDSAGRSTREADRRAQPQTHPGGVTTQHETPRPSNPEPEINYNRDLEDEQSEPGLGLDVDNLSLFVAKMALSNLLEGTDHGLFEMPNNVYKWANRDFIIESFEPDKEPEAYELNGLELTYIPEDWIPHDEDCRVCGTE